MSKYTTEVRWICESKSGFDEDVLKTKTVDEIITASRDSIFNFTYPIYAEGHREELEHKILRHYYTREIGAETFGLWQLQLNDKLNVIMPYYNKLYQYQEQIAQKGLNNIDVTTTQLRTDALKRTDNFTQTDNLKRTEDFTRTDDLTRTDDFTRTDDLRESDQVNRTDALIRTDNFTRTDNLLKTDDYTHGENTEIDKENEIHDNINFTDTTDDKYSDTPQGSLSGVIADTYLTDFRRISKSDNTNQIKTEVGSDTVTGQKTDAGTTANTGTQTNAGTVSNTGSQTINTSIQNTGTQRNAGTSENTGTQRNAGTVDNTGTQKNEGTVDNTGTQSFEGTERGYRGSEIYEKMLSQLSEVIINIDRMIINELADLFFNLW